MALESFSAVATFSCSAPGSLMIMGEHAVLHGHAAIVTAIDKKITVTLTPRDDAEIVIDSAELGTVKIAVKDLAPIKNQYSYVLSALATLKPYWQHIATGFTLQITADFTSKLGFGSSAAVVVATIGVINQWQGLSLSNNETFTLAKTAVHAVAGVGSGADLAASILGGTIYFKMPFTWQRLPLLPQLTAIYSGYKTPTPEVIRVVEQQRLQQPEIYAHLLQSIGLAVEQAVSATLAQNWVELGNIFSLQQRLMAALGVSTARLDGLVAALVAHGAVGAKISGSGLGDCVIALGNVGKNAAGLDLTAAINPAVGEEIFSLTPAAHTAQPLALQLGTTPTIALPRKAREGINNTVLFPPRNNQPQIASASAFAPANIALCKYWGKRDQALNLPVTSSLSISLGNKGATTSITPNSKQVDHIQLNTDQADLENYLTLTKGSDFYQRLVKFLNLFRPKGMYFDIKTSSNIPVAAGLASSAAGFAAITKALDQLFAWQLPAEKLSILARLGSGSACRSLWHGFVVWNQGQQLDGMDSYGEQLPSQWPELQVGILAFTQTAKKISSRLAMQVTVDSCPYYAIWPAQVEQAMRKLTQAITTQNFTELGETAESNCLQMHALMQASKPAIIYSNAQTLDTIDRVWQLRRDGIEVYFTQDAGPNIKLLFLRQQQSAVLAMFPEMEIVDPWVAIT